MEATNVLAKKVVPAVVIEQVELALPLAETMLKAGLNVIEITFRTAAAADAILAIAKRFPEMVVGAGTLLTAEQVRQAADAGSVFGVAPGLSERVVRAAQERGMLMVPGVATASEISLGLELGCKVLKFFPAEAAGGVPALKALAGAFGHTGVRFLPTGGISAKNMADYLAVPVVAGVGGSWMVAKKLIAARDWTAIEKLTREALALAGVK